MITLKVGDIVRPYRGVDVNVIRVGSSRTTDALALYGIKMRDPDAVLPDGYYSVSMMLGAIRLNEQEIPNYDDGACYVLKDRDDQLWIVKRQRSGNTYHDDRALNLVMRSGDFG